MIQSFPKTKAWRNKTLLEMARDRHCLLRIEGVCCDDIETTVACHSNSHKHGKGAARKANDQFSVWGCFTCHRWLDQGPASQEEKEAAFELAHIRQMAQWIYIAKDPSEPERFRNAAKAAMEQLGMGEWLE